VRIASHPAVPGEPELEPQPRWPEQGPTTPEDVRALFERRSSLTVGVEEELMLVDPATLRQVPAIDRVLELVGEDSRFTRELKDTQVEIVTPVSGNAVAACLQLARARVDLATRLAGEVLLVASGTFPLAGDPGDVSEEARYRQIAGEYASATSGSLPCGLHVHVAVRGAERALAVYNAARSYLPEIGALAANSPYVDGEDSHLASGRRSLMGAFHRSGVPPLFPTWEDFTAYVEWGRRGRLFPDASHFWWELRPHTRYGTLELRVADTQTRAEDALAVAAVFQCLVAWLGERHDAGEPLPVHDTVRIEENAWRSMRYGVRGWMVDLDTGEPAPARDRIGVLLEDLERTAERLGVGDGIRTARALLVDNGAERQRYVEAADGLDGLVKWLARETVGSAEDLLTRRV
jgi:carboxylate-amine ligase